MPSRNAACRGVSNVGAFICLGVLKGVLYTFTPHARLVDGKKWLQLVNRFLRGDAVLTPHRDCAHSTGADTDVTFPVAFSAGQKGTNFAARPEGYSSSFQSHRVVASWWPYRREFLCIKGGRPGFQVCAVLRL